MTTENQTNDLNPGKLNKWLANIHFLIVLAVVGFAGGLTQKYGSEIALGFALTALSVALTSWGSLQNSKRFQKVLVVASMVVAVLGVWTFTVGLKRASEAPSFDNVTYEFSALQYTVKGANATPCAPAGTDPLHYTCHVEVTPLAVTPQPTPEQDSTPSGQ